MTKKNIFKIMIFVFCLVVYLIFSNQSAEKSEVVYLSEVKEVISEIEYAKEKLSSFIYLKQKVWNNFIYKINDLKTDSFTKNDNDGFLAEFNEVYKKLLKDDKTTVDINEVRKTKNNILKKFDNIDDSSDRYENTYVYMLELYSAFENLYLFTYLPNENYNIFISNKEILMQKYIDAYKKITKYVE